jgi:hypothetical protein
MNPQDSPQYKADMLIEADPAAPVKLWYFSFAGEEGFRGGLIIHAKSFCGAVTLSHRLGVNPGGELQGMEIAGEIAATVDAKWIGRLLSRTELEAMDAEHKKRGRA